MGFENMFGEDSLSIEKNHILGLLEREGFTPEAQTAVIKWTEQMEKRSLISAIEMVRFNFERAELYEAMGEVNDMFECFDQVLMQVESEKDKSVEGGNWDELSEKIKKIITEMEKKYPLE